MKYKQLVAESLKTIPEMFPWDVEELMNNTSSENYLLLDVREGNEFEAMHIKGSLHVPRGLLEAAADWGFEETEPDLVQARDKKVVVICRSGNRSALAAKTLKDMGFNDVVSMKTGIRGWNDSEYPMVNNKGEEVDIDYAEEFLNKPVPQEKLGPMAVK
jgi:rhodanese-related sulfurtransferase